MKNPTNKPNTVPLAHLNPLHYPDLGRSAFLLLSRLVVLSKDGTQNCIFNNEQGKELGLSGPTTWRAFKQLEGAGLVSVEYKTTPLGPNSRVVTLNKEKVVRSKPDAVPATPKAEAPVTIAIAAPVLETATPKPATPLYTASAPATESSTTPVTDPLSVLCDQPDDEADAKYFATLCFPKPIWDRINKTDPADPLVQRYARYQARRLVAPNSAQMVCHTNLYHFDFAEPLAAMGYGPIRFGIDPNPTTVVDFSEFAEYMSADNATTEPFHYCRKVFAPWLEKYFRFCIMSEISYYSNRLFAKPEECPRLNMQDIKRFFITNQQGFFPTVMAPIFGTDFVEGAGPEDGHWFCSESLWRSISARYIPRPNQSPVPYLTQCVIRQFIDAIADPPMYGDAYRVFEQQFMNFVKCQRWSDMARLALQKDEVLTEHYYPLPLSDLLETYGTRIMFRPSYPMFLMRKTVMTYHVSGLFEWYAEPCLENHYKLLKMAATDPDVKAQWDAFKAFYCHDYPFLNKLEAANV